MKACIILHNMIVEERHEHYEGDMASLQHFQEARATFAHVETFQWETFSAARSLFRFNLPDGMWAKHGCGPRKPRHQCGGSLLVKKRSDSTYMEKSRKRRVRK